MADTRKGLNCLLFYPKDSKTNASFRVRADVLGHGMTMVADSSSSRNARAYYPHRPTPSRFYLRVLLKGYSERKAFADWMQGYANFVMNPGLAAGDSFPDMGVMLANRNFYREGVPLSGFEWGDTIGTVVWTPVITFECTREPQDVTALSASSFKNAQDPEMKYFWPMGTQLGGNAVPSGNYQTVDPGKDGGSDPGQLEDLPVNPMPNEGTPPNERYDYGN
ncbi:hypothetical protein FNV58_00595 (plasmid) [Streptomyces sp. RLB1-9]|uniref:hypothetical protein n=1 Tax=Streptomyces sp. RLB1-9 TaxID=2594454 RepID=UPI0011620B44|nr:hypothetical protein [Streptomyces sp. RLB1-9]QDN94858.1 hypothetical protein FNV58_00595 [Streptomyces sp. RLB1-9]